MKVQAKRKSTIGFHPVGGTTLSNSNSPHCRLTTRTRFEEFVDGVPGLADDAGAVRVVLAERVGDHLAEGLAGRDVGKLQDRRRRGDGPATNTFPSSNTCQLQGHVTQRSL